MPHMMEGGLGRPCVTTADHPPGERGWCSLKRPAGERTKLVVSYLRESTASSLGTILKVLAALSAATITIRFVVTIIIEMRR